MSLAVCVLAVTLAGCNQTLAANRGAGVRGIPVTPQGKLPVLTPAQAKGLMSVPWDLVRIQQGERRIVLTVSSGGCVGLPTGVQLAHTATTITLAVLAPPPKNPQALCTDQRVSKVTTVELPEPLGSRRLLHTPLPHP